MTKGSPTDSPFYFCVPLNRRLPVQHPLLRNLQQIAAILRQQVQRMGDVGNVLDIGVFEAQAVQGFEQIGCGADALHGGFEEVFRVGLGVDDQRCAVGDAAVEREIAGGA